jgi:hypothetical protein
MKLEITFGTYLCYTPTFIINGVAADSNDFGNQGDENSNDAPPYGCGDMTFTPRNATLEVLEKYDITKAEYAVVASQLAAGLSFGNCDLCS